MKKILVFGTFDGLHEGHKDFFRQAKECGVLIRENKQLNYLVVVVGRDSTVQKTKGKLPKFNEQERLKAVQDSGLVDEARLGNQASPGKKLDPYKVVEEVKPDIICLGYDQTHFVGKLEQKIKEMGLNIEIKRLKSYRPETYHSSIMNNK